MKAKNILICGAGGHARSWKAYIDLHENWKLVGIVDTDSWKLEHCESWGIDEDAAYPSIDDAVKWSEEKIDAVLITTPIPTHHLLATTALELGLNVILEKNMASSIEQGQQLVKLAKAHPELCTCMGTQYRFRPNWWTLRQILPSEDSIIGKLAEVHASCQVKQGDMRRGWRSWLQNIYVEDMMVHHIDLLRYCCNMEIIKVQAQVFTPNYSKWLGTSAVSANLIMAPPGKELDKDEWINCTYYGNWQSRGIRDPWQDSFAFYGEKGSIQIEPPIEANDKNWEQSPGMPMPLAGEPPGTRIVAYLDNKDFKGTEVKELEKHLDIEGNPQNYNDQMYLLDEFARCIESKGNIQPMINFEEGLKSFLVARGAIESSKTGNTVWLPKYWHSPILEP
jgi:predicted dehydrogenase